MFEHNAGQTDGRTDGWTNRHGKVQSRMSATKNENIIFFVHKHSVTYQMKGNSIRNSYMQSKIIFNLPSKFCVQCKIAPALHSLCRPPWVIHIAKVCYFFSPCLHNVEWLILGPLPSFYFLLFTKLFHSLCSDI